MELPLASLVNERLVVVALRGGNPTGRVLSPIMQSEGGLRTARIAGVRVRRNQLPYEFQLSRALPSNILEPLNGALAQDLRIGPCIVSVRERRNQERVLEGFHRR